MSTTTSNLGLTKPDLTDNADITVINANMDVIDASMSTKANVLASVQDVNISTTSPQTIASFTPTVNGNFEIEAYLRILNGLTNVTITVAYNDETGAQTEFIQAKQNGLFFPCASGIYSYKIGSYTMAPLFINAIAGNPITITLTSNIANQAHISCAIVEV